jgi:aspartyl protease family protein
MTLNCCNKDKKMKVITIGRELNNNVVINDSKVSRRHIQITSDGGIYRIVDFNSANGTFVNGQRIKSEMRLMSSDSVRIGNTNLPWQSYFANAKTVEKTTDRTLVWISVAVLALVIFTTGIYFVFNIQNKTQQQTDTATASSKTVIKMHEENGVRYVPMKVNGQELNFIFDTGASSICISTLEAAILVKNGLLTKKDVIGQQGFIDATGGFSTGTKINLKTISIGDRVLHNIEATIIENPNAECLLGQTALSRFGKYTIDNQNRKIIFE